MQTKPDEGDREAPLKDETRRRREDEGKDEAEGESRRRKPKTKSTTGQQEEEEEEEAAQRRTMPACHRKIRSDGKADEEAKYQKANTKETQKKPCRKRHTHHLTSSGLCAQVQDSTLCGVLLLRGSTPSKHFFSTKIREHRHRHHRSSLRVCCRRFRLCFTLRRCIYLCLGPFLYLGMTYHDFF